MTIKTRGIVEAGSEFRLPAGFFQGLTLASVAGPAFEFTEAGAAVAAGHTFGAGVVVIRRADDGSSDDSVFTLTEPGDGSGGVDGRGIASMTISGGRLTGTYTDGTAWDAGALPSGPTGAKGDKGDKGDPGPAATVTVGTVTTGAAGTQASVTNSGSSSAAVLNFTIPRGADGSGGSGGTLDPEAVQDLVGGMIRAGTGVGVVYDDAAGTVTVSASGGGGSASLPAGGTTGQRLTKLSPVDGDAGWMTPEGAVLSNLGTESWLPTERPTDTHNYFVVGPVVDGGGKGKIYTRFAIPLRAANVVGGERVRVAVVDLSAGFVVEARDYTLVAGQGEIRWDSLVTVPSGTRYAFVSGTLGSSYDDLAYRFFEAHGAYASPFANRLTAYSDTRLPATGAAYAMSSIDTSRRRVVLFYGENVAKNTRGSLDPVDFPVSTVAEAPARSGFMVVNDDAKTASLYWKFSDGSTKKLDLA
ncbi:hypothetical protein SAMN04488058_101283 [Deinococcus reticulitermitis]|uniref:Collagen triple helix repeat-containing protein n=1 Tax=Deinococcus reticulitermitis TaxID=856736 RepID=A0A1H6SKU7_9DEIO|nr:hypothetical protein [Deinococcus reticulitermitis]SEI66514.1 hypothetical protein SAMN04488058_101283 [Deinococcus reticulitermitis]